MAPSKKFLKELNEKMDHFTIKVKVIENTRERSSPNKTRYQKIRFQDEQGGKMQATIFGDNIALYGKAVKFEKEYEITNAKIKPIKEQYRTSEEQYEIEFVDTIVIRPLFQASSSDDMPQYCEIGTIPGVPYLPDRYDVLGIALYVEPLRTVVGLLDPMPIVGLTALKSSTHKGYSLAATVSTSIIIDPKGEKLETLLEWVKANKDDVMALKEYVHAVRSPANNTIVRPISYISEKKVTHTLQDEELWICGRIMKVEDRSVCLCLGCDRCGRKSHDDKGATFNCNFSSCKNRSSTSVPRVTFGFNLYDETGCIALTAFSDDATKLLGKDANALHNMAYETRNKFLKQAIESYKDKLVYTQVTPGAAFAINKIMSCVVSRKLAIAQNDLGVNNLT
ncbi:hypothetical protein Cgig2_023571 [Carnegiea gigantea]|uniref:Uncharacterized protein n=1 Tax=Carnegiea gigantea TaxID=171969 RepID=A0A9Q1GJC6_9CARY|nr:hypothetical protein Cgig2_023571 [Carnegiea gigantea]